MVPGPRPGAGNLSGALRQSDSCSDGLWFRPGQNPLVAHLPNNTGTSPTASECCYHVGVPVETAQDPAGIASPAGARPFWRPPAGPSPQKVGSLFLRRWIRERPVYLPGRLQLALDVALLLGIMAVLLVFFPPKLLLSVTTTTGGDTGAHIYTPWYLRNNLLPRGQISGWSPGWYGGFPMLYFYFPLIALFQALLSYLIPFGVAFKLGTVLGTFFLPVAVYVLFRLMRFAWPAPALGALASLAFLFMDSFSIYGGNIKSSLAGEYSYSLSLGLSLVFVGLMYRVATEGKGRPLLASGVLALAVLSHLLPVAMVLLISPLLLLWAVRSHGWGAALRRFGVVYGLAFALSGFWVVPFLVRLPYTADMRWVPLRGWSWVFPKEIWLYLGGFVLALLVAALRRDRRLLIFLAMSTVSLSLYRFLPAGSVWNGRFLPFHYLAAILAGAYLAAAAIQALSRAISVRRMGAATLILGLGAGAAMGIWALGLRESTYIDSWITDNYRGYESRKDFPAFRELNDRLAQLPPGRVFWEPNDLQGKFGTPIALMSIPFWSGQPTMEGINYESSMTTPFHFLTASEVADRPANPIPGLPYQSLDLRRGARHLALLDVRYYLAFTQPAKDSAALAGMRKMQDIGEFTLFAVDTPGQVVIPARKPVAYNRSGSRWTERNIAWFGNLKGLDRPLVRIPARQWARIARLKPPAQARSIPARIRDDRISFTTDAVGQPHWIKTSYFPNWKVKGARGPYLASPSMMMVVPTQSEVTLYFARTWVEWTGMALTAVGLILLVWPRSRQAIALAGGRGLSCRQPGGGDSPRPGVGGQDHRNSRCLLDGGGKQATGCDAVRPHPSRGRAFDEGLDPALGQGGGVLENHEHGGG